MEHVRGTGRGRCANPESAGNGFPFDLSPEPILPARVPLYGGCASDPTQHTVVEMFHHMPDGEDLPTGYWWCPNCDFVEWRG